LNAAEFVAKWQDVALTEQSAAQQHFLDLCDVVGHPEPAAVDPKGEWFTFERGAARRGGGDGWDPDMTDEEVLEKLLALNLERA